jgi:NRPS condensation-like uncharacterized protein
MNRPLSAFEQISWLAEQVLCLNFVVVAHLLEPLNEDALTQALNLIQDRHPPLQCKIKQGEVPLFISEDVPPIPLKIIDRKDDDHWIEEAEKGTREVLPWKTGPLARVSMLKSPKKCDLVFTFNHIIADATSGVKVIRELLGYVDTLSRGEKPNSQTPLAQLPATHDIIKKNLKYPPGFLDIFGRVERALYKPVELPDDVKVPPEKRITRVIQRILSQSETKRLISRSRKENTSVHGALCAAVLQTIIEKIRASKNLKVRKKGPLMIGCMTPINIRHLLSVPVKDDIGNFISDAFHYQLIDDKSSLWAAARKVKKSIQREIKFGRDIKAVLGVGEIMNTNPSPIDIIKSVSQLVPPVFVTNMGRLDIPERFGEIVLENLHFILSINPTAKNGFAMAVTSFRGGITINFFYADPYLSKEKAVNMVESTMKRLKDAIKE